MLGAAGLFAVGLRIAAQNPARAAQVAVRAAETVSASADAAPGSTSKAPAPTALPTFEDVTEKSGINFRHSFGETKLSSMHGGHGLRLRMD